MHRRAAALAGRGALVLVLDELPIELVRQRIDGEVLKRKAAQARLEEFEASLARKRADRPARSLGPKAEPPSLLAAPSGRVGGLAFHPRNQRILELRDFGDVGREVVGQAFQLGPC